MENKVKLYKKLLTIQQKVSGLGKDKDTKSPQNPNGYAYVTGNKVLDHIKPLMNELGLLLKQEVISCNNERQDYNTKYGSKSEILSSLSMKFTWVDCETGETDENMFGANGQNDWEKGYGSALTYAERYFLLKFFHIATDEDDIDNPDRKSTPPVPIKEPAKEPTTDEKVANMQNKPKQRTIDEYKAEIAKIDSATGLNGYYTSLSNPEKANQDIVALLTARRKELNIPKK
jgi:hypothetical protein